MVGSTVPLVTLQIADALSGNVLDRAGEHGARAQPRHDRRRGLVMAVYLPLQTRSADGCGDPILETPQAVPPPAARSA